MKARTEEERFQYCVNVIIEHEGGLSNDKRDAGGVTNYGISLRFLRTIGMDIDGDGDSDSEDIIALTRPGAKQIYRKFWWLKYNYERINHLEVVAKVFDLSVNMGGIAAHKILQTACNNFMPTPLKVDGILGNKTLYNTNYLDPKELREELRLCAKDKYMKILAANPAFECFKNGWMTRAKW